MTVRMRIFFIPLTHAWIAWIKIQASLSIMVELITNSSTVLSSCISGILVRVETVCWLPDNVIAPPYCHPVSKMTSSRLKESWHCHTHVGEFLCLLPHECLDWGCSWGNDLKLNRFYLHYLRISWWRICEKDTFCVLLKGLALSQ